MKPVYIYEIFILSEVVSFSTEPKKKKIAHDQTCARAPALDF